MSTGDPIEAQRPTQPRGAVKISIFGGGGSGVSTTALLAAIGLSKQYADGAPIVMLDTERRAPYVLELASAAEGIAVLPIQSSDFAAMLHGLDYAERLGASAYLVDDHTRVYEELAQALRVQSDLVGRRMPAHQQDQIAVIWHDWIARMRDSRVPCLLCSRVGYAVNEVADESGPRLIALGTQPRGPRDAMHDAPLVVEMEARHNYAKRATQGRRARGSIVHLAYVLKDRTMALNGRTISFRTLNGYQAGDYLPVFEALRPHFEAIPSPTLAGAIEPVTQNLDALPPNTSYFAPLTGESAFTERQRRIKIATENLSETLDLLWPGKSDASKACRLGAVEALFWTRSWTALEQLAPETIERGVEILQRLEREQGSDGFPTTRLDVLQRLAGEPSPMSNV